MISIAPKSRGESGRIAINNIVNSLLSAVTSNDFQDHLLFIAIAVAEKPRVAPCYFEMFYITNINMLYRCTS